LHANSKNTFNDILWNLEDCCLCTVIVSSSLQNASDNRDCEHKLVLLGYDQFQFIKVLFKNRWISILDNRRVLYADDMFTDILISLALYIILL